VTRIRNEAVRGNDPYTQRSAGIDLAYVLFDFGVRAASLENARQLFSAAAFSRDATVQTIFLAAVQAFFQRQAAAAVLEATQQSEKAALESLNAAEARYQVGTATPADRLQARTAHAQAVLNRIGAEGAVKTAQGTLANVIGTDPTRPLELAPLPPAAPNAGFEADVVRLIDEARARRPDLAAAEAQFRAAQANIEAAKAAHLPTLSLGVGAGRSQIAGQPAYDSSSIGLTLNIPLFSGFSTTYKVRAAEAQADLQAARREQVRLQVALDVWNAYASLTTATQSVKTAGELLESATQSERVAAGRYRAGVGSILDLLTAQAALASARQSRIQAGTNWFVSRSALAQAMGALDAGLLTALFPPAAGAGN
jgi:TolC family type I secretion outer membrane protein